MFEVERMTEEEHAKMDERMNIEAMEIFKMELRAWMDERPQCSAAEVATWVRRVAP